MWYGSSHRICERREQAKQAYSVIQNYHFDKTTKFRELIDRGIDKMVAARIIHLLHNQDFGAEEYVE
jgi:hypothetical protein